MSMVDRISELARNIGLSISALEKAVGLSNGIIGKWKKQSPSCDKLKLVADYLNTTIDYLLTGKEKSSPTVELTADERELLDIYNNLSPKSQGRLRERAEVLAELEAPAADEPDQEEPKVIMIRFVPLSVSAGTGEPLPEDSRSTYLKIKHSDVAEEADYAVRINGDSMLPRFKDNDIVLVKAQDEIEEGNIGIFTINGEGFIKELGKKRLISLNPEYDDVYFEEGQDIRCKGLVIATLEKEDFV
ncbi:MAG: hypothetical protein E7500_00225 [Ruminococcus sp.]|nr:hypothetical protein [Ruminococcus sp.]